MTAALGLMPAWAWRWIAMGVLVVSCFGVGYFKGWSGEHGKLIEFQAEVKATGLAAKKHADDVNKANAALTQSLEVRNNELTKNRNAAIIAQRAADKLRDDNAARSKLPEPTERTALGVGSATDDRVSKAIRDFALGARAALAECGSAARDFADRSREGAAAADANTDSLMTLQEFERGKR